MKTFAINSNISVHKHVCQCASFEEARKIAVFFGMRCFKILDVATGEVRDFDSTR